MSIPIYEAIFDENLKGVFGISLVEDPATREYFVRLSKDEKKAIKERMTDIRLSTIDIEQRILLGLVLEPDVPIYRNTDGEEFYITFNAETIKKFAHAFISNGYQLNSSIEHNENKIKGIAFVESWIVDDPDKDKTNSYDLKYKKGSWVVAMKVSDDTLWNDYVKTGKVNGFSIDAVVKLREKTNPKNTKMKFIDKIKEVAITFAEKLKAELKLGQIKIKDEDVTLEYEGEIMEVGASIFAIDPENPDTKIPLPVGKFPLEDGTVLIVTEEGIVGEIMPADAAPADPPPVDDPTLSDAGKTVNEIKSILIKYEETFKGITESFVTLNANLEALKAEFEVVKGEVIKFSEKPRDKPRTPRPDVKLNKDGRILEILRK